MRQTMRAAVVTGYGPPDRVVIRDLPRPVPKAGEVLIHVVATTVSTADWRIRSMTVPRGFGLLMPLIFGLRAPRQPVLGTECAGVVAAVGPGVTAFAPGDAVVGYVGAAAGCHAEFVRAPVSKLIPKPAALTWDEAAAMSFGGCTALAFLRAGGLAAGKRVLVIGATGTVGSAAVQIAAAAGAIVTATGRDTDRAMLAGLGAAAVIDNRAADIGGGWDIVLDAVGAERWATIRPRLAPGGRFLMVAADLPAMIGAALRRGDRRAVSLMAPERAEDMAALARMAAAGTYRPLIDGTWTLSEMTAAHARVETGRKRGAVVVRVDADAAEG